MEFTCSSTLPGLAAMNEPRLNLPELTVSELSSALKRTIEEAYGYVRVRGELGKVSYHGNGHVYFDLKDDRACIAGVIWRSTALRIQLRLEAGLEVVVTGRLTTYPGTLSISDHRRDAGTRRDRRADGAPRRAQAKTRRRRIVR